MLSSESSLLSILMKKSILCTPISDNSDSIPESMEAN